MHNYVLFLYYKLVHILLFIGELIKSYDREAPHGHFAPSKPRDIGTII